MEHLKEECAELKALKRMFADLCHVLPIDELFPSMLSHRVIGYMDKAEISAERTEHGRVEHFLCHYLSKDLRVANGWRFYRFLAVMKQSPKCNGLVKGIESWLNQDSLKLPEHQLSTEAILAEAAFDINDRPVEYHTLVRMTGDLCNDLPIDELIPKLMAHGVIDSRDRVNICSEIVKQRRVEVFLEKYLVKQLGFVAADTSIFYKFLEVMKMEESQECSTLVERMEYWLNQYKQHFAKRKSENEKVIGARNTNDYNKLPAQKKEISEVTTIQPRAFIVYAKEKNDPNGEQILCLSNLLTNGGIACDIDLYHINENVPDWSLWVKSNLDYHIATNHGYIILVCSSTIMSILEERNDNAYVDMVAAHIDRLTLRHYLENYTHKFLPLLINNSTADYVHPCLSGKTFYHFPYSKVFQFSEDASIDQVLGHPDFASLRSLVATLTRQQEILIPTVGPAVGVHSQRTSTVSTPQLVRDDLDLPPSTIDPYTPYEYTNVMSLCSRDLPTTIYWEGID